VSIFEGAEELVEEAFPPRPGGLVDRHRKRVAQEQADAEEARNADHGIEQIAVRAVKIAQQSPESFATPVIPLAAGQIAMLLPANPYRYRAVLYVAANNSGFIQICKDKGAALSGNGFLLPAYANAVEMRTRGQVWGLNSSTDGTVVVYAIAEYYAPEEKS
jgi:hypothetical protein